MKQFPMKEQQRRHKYDGQGSRRWKLTTHKVEQADGTTIDAPILKPRQTSKYMPRRNTPRAQR
jgi:hypothetical protein